VTDIAAYIASQLPYLAPMLLAYLAGILLSALKLRQLGKPAALALTGCVILLVNTAVFPFVQWYVLSARAQTGTPGNFASLMLMVSLARSAVHITGFGLLLAAVFAGRRSAWTPGFDVRMEAAERVSR
jgi:hypothetical protein